MGGRRFRAYEARDRSACLELFDANCPDSFAPNEREEYADFLDSEAAEYEICVWGEGGGERVVGAFGLLGDDGTVRLRWIMVDPARQGSGLGSAIMSRVIDAGRERGEASLSIAASHRSAPFFSKFGAVVVRRTEDGWGPGMHRVDMELTLMPEG